MLTFIFYTIIFLLAIPSAIKIWHFAIQGGQALDLLFGYQKWLDRLYSSPSIIKNILGKMMGNCVMCMSFWASLIGTSIYFIFMINQNCWAVDGWINGAIWLLVFNFLCTILSVYFITKLFEK